MQSRGDDTLVWTLSAPYPDFRHAIASHFHGIHPKKQIVEKTPAEYFKKPVSAGPLMLAEWTPGTDLMVLKANPHYWAKPHVQELRVIVIPDATSRLLALQQGSVDYVYTLPLNAASQVDASKVSVFNHAEPGTFMLAVNNYEGQPNAALKDKKVRQAMSLVIDRKKLAEVGFFGIPEPACAYAFKPGNPYFQCSLPNDGRPDVAAAKARLAETRWPNGFAFEMIVPARPQWAEAAQVVAADLAKIGVTANVKPLPDADITTRIRATELRAGVLPQRGPDADPATPELVLSGRRLGRELRLQQSRGRRPAHRGGIFERHREDQGAAAQARAARGRRLVLHPADLAVLAERDPPCPGSPRSGQSGRIPLREDDASASRKLRRRLDEGHRRISSRRPAKGNPTGERLVPLRRSSASRT